MRKENEAINLDETVNEVVDMINEVIDESDLDDIVDNVVEQTVNAIFGDDEDEELTQVGPDIEIEEPERYKDAEEKRQLKEKKLADRLEKENLAVAQKKVLRATKEIAKGQRDLDKERKELDKMRHDFEKEKKAVINSLNKQVGVINKLYTKMLTYIDKCTVEMNDTKEKIDTEMHRIEKLLQYLE